MKLSSALCRVADARTEFSCLHYRVVAGPLSRFPNCREVPTPVDVLLMIPTGGEPIDPAHGIANRQIPIAKVPNSSMTHFAELAYPCRTPRSNEQAHNQHYDFQSPKADIRAKWPEKDERNSLYTATTTHFEEESSLRRRAHSELDVVNTGFLEVNL